MKRKDERLDQKLGDFAPLHQPINEIHLERLLDRYGIALVCDYPQILFEHHDQMRLPGWWYREAAPGYLAIGYGHSPGPLYPQDTARDGPALRGPWPVHRDPLEALCEGYRVLDAIFSPAPKAADYPRGPRRQAYAATGRRAYS